MKIQFWKKWMAATVCMSMLVSGCGTDAGATRQGKTELQQEDSQQDAAEQEDVRQDVAQEDVQRERSSGDGEGRAVVMVYMVGSNLESEAGLASYDISEMIESDFDEENMDVLICTGGANEWWIEGVDSDVCDVYEIVDGGLDRVYRLKNANMGDENTLKEFINFSYANYDGEYYDLVMWDHGGGAVLGFGADENYGYDALSMSEISNGLRKTKFIADGNKFEWIGFDACLMGMIEVADMLSDYSNYLIASEEVEAGTGWEYSCLKTLSDGEHFDGVSAAEEIIDAFSKSSENTVGYRYDYTLACLDLSRVEDAVESFEALIVEAEEEVKSGGYSRIARKRDETKTFGKVSSTSFYDTIDMYDFAMNLMKFYPEQAEALQSALDDLVVYERSNVMDAHGVAVYFPYENQEYVDEWMTEYEKIGFSDTYISFLKTFTATLSGEQLAEWDITELEPEESEETEGEYYVQLTEDQAENYARAKFTVWEEDSEGSYICWLLSTDVTLADDGKLSSPFRGERFFLTDDSGVLVPCTALEIERTEEYSMYSISIMAARGNIGDGDFSFQSLEVHVRVDEEHPDGEIAGIYITQDEEDSLFPEKTYYTLEEGDAIYQFLFARDIVFNEDGSVAPFEEWESSSGIGAGFELSGDLQVVLMEPEEVSQYCCLFDVTDTQGNSYYTNPVYLEY